MSRAVAASLLVLLCPLRSVPEPAGLGPAVSGGVVVDEDGRPLQGVRYWVSAHEELTSEGWTLVQFLGIAQMQFTGEDGRFEVPAREGLRCDVDFDASGYVPSFVQEFELGEDVRVVMHRGFDVRGRVRQRQDGSIRPAEHARVSIRRPNARGLWFETEVLADSAGEFVFPGFLARSDHGEECSPEGWGWQLSCSGAVFELPERVDRPLDDIEVEISIRRGR